jgi:PUA domain protein
LKIYSLSKKDIQKIREYLGNICPKIPSTLKLKEIKKVEIDEKRNILISDKIVIIEFKGLKLPFLKEESYLECFPHVVVDSGAIQYICKGANVMRRGIICVDGFFNKGEVVTIQDPKFKKNIAIGVALLDSSEINKIDRGLVIDNIHYVGDKFWEIYKKL